MRARSIPAALLAVLPVGCVSLGSTHLAITPAGFATVHSFGPEFTTNEEISAAEEAIAKALRDSESSDAGFRRD